MSLINKVAIVTGGERGIGLGITRELLEKGMQVCMAGIDKPSANAAMNELNAGERLIFHYTDVCEESDVSTTVKETVLNFGRLDTVVANAGLPKPHSQPVETMELDEWDKIIRTNLTGVFLCAKHAFPELRKNKGSMVLIASTRALQSQPDGVAYSASKGGILALSHSLAMSGAPDIRVNVISPGWICHERPEDLPERAARVHPVGRVGRPADIAKMVAYLASDDAGFITAENFVIDGGMTRKMNYS